MKKLMFCIGMVIVAIPIIPAQPTIEIPESSRQFFDTFYKFAEAAPPLAKDTDLSKILTNIEIGRAHV